MTVTRCFPACHALHQFHLVYNKHKVLSKRAKRITSAYYTEPQTHLRALSTLCSAKKKLAGSEAGAGRGCEGDSVHPGGNLAQIPVGPFFFVLDANDTNNVGEPFFGSDQSGKKK